MRWLPAAAFWIAFAACAQDSPLESLHSTLVALHAHGGQGLPPAELTVAKHQLRDWIETQLVPVRNAEEAEQLADRINEKLRAVSVAEPEDGQNLLGVIDEVNISNKDGLLIVTTRFGILCEFDESAYGYRRTGDRWQRVWESEQNDYSSNEKYSVQTIGAIHVWKPWIDEKTASAPFVMTLGNSWGCASSWHPVYYRVWRVDPTGSKLLIDGEAFAWNRSGSFVVGSIGAYKGTNKPVADVVIEYTVASIDGGIHNRESLRHFRIDGDKATRIDPVALSPRDFVDEWISLQWTESAVLSSSPALRQPHEKHPDGEFGDTMKCKTPDLWQVNLGEAYFLVRWRPPFHFTMVKVNAKPWPACITKDPEADEWRTLFSTQEWR